MQNAIIPKNKTHDYLRFLNWQSRNATQTFQIRALQAYLGNMFESWFRWNLCCINKKDHKFRPCFMKLAKSQGKC